MSRWHSLFWISSITNSQTVSHSSAVMVLAVVLVAVAGQAPHLGGNFAHRETSRCRWLMRVRMALQFGHVVQGPIAKHDDAAVENDGFHALCRRPSDRPLLPSIVAPLAPAGGAKDALASLSFTTRSISSKTWTAWDIRAKASKSPRPLIRELNSLKSTRAVEVRPGRCSSWRCRPCRGGRSRWRTQGHALRVVADELQFRFIGLKMQIVFRGD